MGSGVPRVLWPRARAHHTATLLPSGKVLVSGGIDPDGFLTGAEVYEDTGVQQAWRPVITPTAKQQQGEIFHITGSLLRGLSESSSGNTQSSATNFPLASLLALDRGTFTRITSLDSVSDTSVTVRMPRVPDGYYILSVMTNAIHGGQIVLVEGPLLRAPAITSPGAFVNTEKPVIAGTAEPGSTVKAWLNDEEMDEVIPVDAAGDWRFIPPTALEFGYHSVSAIAIDDTGNLSAPSQHTFAYQQSHYGWVCTTTPILSATWALWVLALALGRARATARNRP